jgi:polar amino acid transport system permease protein
LAWFCFRGRSRRDRLAATGAALNLAAAITIAVTGVAYPYVSSVVANGVDSFTSELVVKGETPRRLTDAAELAVHGYASALFWAYLVLTIIALGLIFIDRGKGGNGRAWRAGRTILAIVSGAGLAFILFLAPMAFAAGVATTIRAAIAAYVLAAILGLVWVGLLKLEYSVRAHVAFIVITGLLALAAAWFLLQPRRELRAGRRLWRQGGGHFRHTFRHHRLRALRPVPGCAGR